MYKPVVVNTTDSEGSTSPVPLGMCTVCKDDGTTGPMVTAGLVVATRRGEDKYRDEEDDCKEDIECTGSCAELWLEVTTATEEVEVGTD